eukprot:TRINITY_DN5817_c0_g4_i1.p1 TRINITY_DN5817_c0_g4~~TRINITY_DN5817_c0_g4_i1.p1  ORF type:complete len:216 (-),score=34.87 TRINITY_DN5817_c0_g4_i1:43-690(-)
MDGSRAAGMDLVDISDQLQRQGYCVWDYGSNSQLELSACAGLDGRWKLADVNDFPKVCGSGVAPGPSPPPAPPTPPGPKPSGGICQAGRHGPGCASDADCKGHPGCLRCARSGFCTDVPLPWKRHSFLNERTEMNTGSVEKSVPAKDEPDAVQGPGSSFHNLWHTRYNVFAMLLLAFLTALGFSLYVFGHWRSESSLKAPLVPEEDRREARNTIS